MEVTFQNVFTSLIYEEDLNILTIKQSSKKPSLDEYQKPFKTALDFMHDKPVGDYISDIREQAIVTTDFKKWLQEARMSEAGDADMKRNAGAANIYFFNRYCIHHVSQSDKKSGLPLKMVYTIEEAKSWFRKSE